MSFEKLLNLIPPPKVPVWREGEDNIELAEQTLGIELPQDYKQIVKAYGSGGFWGYFGIWAPVGKGELCARNTGDASDFYRNQSTYHVFPEAGGILGFASDEYIDQLFWITNGPPSDWKLVMFEFPMVEPEEFPYSLSEFLCRVALGELVPRAFEPSFASEGLRWFKQSTPSQLRGRI